MSITITHRIPRCLNMLFEKLTTNGFDTCAQIQVFEGNAGSVRETLLF